MLQNSDVLKEIIACRATGVVSDHLNKMIHQVIDHVGKHHHWNRCKELPQLKVYAHAFMLTTCLKFNPAKSSKPIMFLHTRVLGCFCYKWSYLRRDKLQLIHQTFMTTQKI